MQTCVQKISSNSFKIESSPDYLFTNPAALYNHLTVSEQMTDIKLLGLHNNT